MRAAIGTAAALVVAFAAGAAAMPAWWEVAQPAPGPAAAVGTPARGCLAGARALSLSGPGFEVMRPSRRRFFGHPELIGFVEALAAAAQAEGLAPLLVGDLAQPRGGPMPGGHASHQTGLDVDIWFRPAPGRGLGADTREALSAISMVAADGRRVDPGVWGAGQAALVRLAAGFAAVDRIFVNAAIKAELCASAVAGDRGWLRKIRPWWGHDHHFHVRLRCPSGDVHCEDQPALPAGDGCDEGLAWWFSAEAAAELAKRAAAPPRRPSLDALPASCRTILGAPSAADRAAAD